MVRVGEPCEVYEPPRKPGLSADEEHKIRQETLASSGFTRRPEDPYSGRFDEPRNQAAALAAILESRGGHGDETEPR
jgi:hypothetical protein